MEWTDELRLNNVDFAAQQCEVFVVSRPDNISLVRACLLVCMSTSVYVWILRACLYLEKSPEAVREHEKVLLIKVIFVSTPPGPTFHALSINLIYFLSPSLPHSSLADFFFFSFLNPNYHIMPTSVALNSLNSL